MWPIVILVLAGFGFITALAEIDPTRSTTDAMLIVGAVFGFIITITASWRITKDTKNDVHDLHILVNHRMDDLLATTEEKGKLIGAKEQRQATKVGEDE